MIIDLPNITLLSHLQGWSNDRGKLHKIQVVGYEITRPLSAPRESQNIRGDLAQQFSVAASAEISTFNTAHDVRVTFVLCSSTTLHY